jgi:hypothetical protein
MESGPKQELNHLETLEVKDIVNEMKSDYCKKVCANIFVNHDQLNNVLYIIGAVFVGASILAIGWGFTQSNATAAIQVKTEVNTAEMARFKTQLDDLQTTKNNTDSIWATVKTLRASGK